MEPADKSDPGLGAGVTPTLIRRFRLYTALLAASWLFFGTFPLVVLLLLRPRDVGVWLVALVISAVWLVLGVRTHQRRMWAVAVGTGLCYLMVVSGVWAVAQGRHVVDWRGCLPVVGIILGHRVQSLARALGAAGLSVHAKPGRCGVRGGAR